MADLYSEFDLLGRLMDVSALRARVIAHNVANQNTPGFRRKAVAFEEALDAALTAGPPLALDRLAPTVVEAAGGEIKPDGNNVSLEEEIAMNVKNGLYYQVVNEAARWRFALYRDALQER